MATIYLAGGLFNAGERLHNLYLEKHLEKLGHTIILPQREALKFFKDNEFDIKGITNDCLYNAANPSIVFVGNTDGADSDSGTCVEYGVAISNHGHVITYRTDFRTAIEKEVGVNAMLRVGGTKFIYSPCYFTDLEEVDDFYSALAQKIHEAILSQ